MELVLLTIRLALFGIFALAGVGKLLDLEGAEKAVKNFGTPEPFAKTFAVLIPIAELIFAFCFLFPSTSWVGAIGGLLLMVSFIGAMLVQMIGGNEADCHCFGQIHSGRVGPKTLIRNILIAILPIALIVNGRDAQGPALGSTDGQIASNVAIAIVTVAVTVVASYLVKALAENKKLSRKLELMEMLDNSGQPVERDELGDPRDSLPIGAILPPFGLSDAAGGTVTNRDIEAAGLPTLYLFVGPNCEPCRSLVRDFAGWKREMAGKVKFVIVSKGYAEDSRQVFGEAALNDMLFQRTNEYAKRLYIYWTPTALLVTADGTIASHPALGDEAIRKMLDRLGSDEIEKENYFIPNPTKAGRVNIGKRVRAFDLPDLRGNSVTDTVFQNKQTLALFLSKSCSFCAEFVDQLRVWETSPDRNGTDAIVFTDGDADYGLAYELKTPVVLDSDHKIATELGMFGAPSAVLIDEEGRIVSETAVGGGMIWSLIGRHGR